MDKWWTVTLIADDGDIENGPSISAWDHPFNYYTAKEAWDAAVQYYSEMPEVTVTYIRPATYEEVVEYLKECYGPDEDEIEPLPF